MSVDRQAALDSETANPLYAPSWIDRMGAWLEGLPGPIWLYYLLGFLGFALLINVVFWIDGTAQPGAFDPFNSIYAVLSIYWAALYHYLTVVAARSLRDFRPLLDVTESEYRSIEHELTTLPSWQGWLAIPLGLVLAITQTIGDAPSFGDVAPNSVLPSVGDAAITWFIAASFLCLLVRSFRQLRMVSRLHARSVNFDLLELDPARAFSNLTAQTGIGVILLLVVAYAWDPLAFGSTSSVILSIAMLAAAIGIFVLPILGIQNRIGLEKDRVLHQIHGLLGSARDQLHAQVGAEDYQNVGDVNHAIEALMRERDLIKGVPTWPWNPRTLRGFASALLLPIFLWLVTRVLERLF